MYIVTNREILERKRSFGVFGKRPNTAGPHELRLVEVTRAAGGDFKVSSVKDSLSPTEIKQLDLPEGETAFPSRLIAQKLLRRLRREKKHLVLFVHGYNNNVKAVAERAFRLQERFGVEVLAFSWPANGGGVRGVLDYKSDKKDARASIGALDRVLEKIRNYLAQMRAEEIEKIRNTADRRFTQDAESRDEFLARKIREQCPVNVSLMLHSMGNYLFKQLLKSTLYSADELLFENVIMAAADVNNERHPEWLDKIQFRNRLYITINENDSALRLSRMKGGREQLARLGHFPYELESNRAVYVDFTSAKFVGDSHSYFEGSALRNKNVKKFFSEALNGNAADGVLDYNAARNLHSLLP